MKREISNDGYSPVVTEVAKTAKTRVAANIVDMK